MRSPKTYTHGLFIADIQAMPYGCAVWPAFWSVGPNWPNDGMQPGLTLFFISSDNLHQGRSTSSKVLTINLRTNIPSILVQIAPCLQLPIIQLRARWIVLVAFQAIIVAVHISTLILTATAQISTRLMEAYLLISGTMMRLLYGISTENLFPVTSPKRNLSHRNGVILSPTFLPLIAACNLISGIILWS